MSGGESGKILEIYKKSIAMVWGKVEMGEKVRPDDSVLDICYCEIELKVGLTYCDRASSVAVALDFRAVRRAKLSSGSALAALLTSGRYDGE